MIILNFRSVNQTLFFSISCDVIDSYKTLLSLTLPVLFCTTPINVFRDTHHLTYTIMAIGKGSHHRRVELRPEQEPLTKPVTLSPLNYVSLNLHMKDEVYQRVRGRPIGPKQESRHRRKVLSGVPRLTQQSGLRQDLVDRRSMGG